MNETPPNFRSLSWWLSAFVAGIIIHVLAAYTKSFFDRIVARFSVRVRAKQKAANDQFEKQVKYVLSRPDGLILVSLEEIKTKLMAAVCILTALFLAVVPFFSSQTSIIPRTLRDILTFISLLIGFGCLTVSQKQERILRAAEQRRMNPGTAARDASSVDGAERPELPPLVIAVTSEGKSVEWPQPKQAPGGTEGGGKEATPASTADAIAAAARTAAAAAKKASGGTDAPAP